MKVVIGLLFTVLSFGIVHSQSLVQHYDIHIGSENAGSAIIKKEVQGAKTIYTMNSKASFHVMGIGQLIEETLKVVYWEGKLFSSDVVVNKNGKLHKSTKVTLLTNGQYKLVTNGNDHFYKEPIMYSSMMMYFDEPLNKEKTFAEGQGVLKNISKVDKPGKNYYSVREGYHGNPSDFYYTNGKLTKVVVDYHVTTFEMIRR